MLPTGIVLSTVHTGRHLLLDSIGLHIVIPLLNVFCIQFHPPVNVFSCYRFIFAYSVAYTFYIEILSDPFVHPPQRISAQCTRGYLQRCHTYTMRRCLLTKPSGVATEGAITYYIKKSAQIINIMSVNFVHKSRCYLCDGKQCKSLELDCQGSDGTFLIEQRSISNVTPNGSGSFSKTPSTMNFVVVQKDKDKEQLKALLLGKR